MSARAPDPRGAGPPARRPAPPRPRRRPGGPSCAGGRGSSRPRARAARARSGSTSRAARPPRRSAPFRLVERLRRVPAQVRSQETSLPTILRPTTWGLTNAAVVSTSGSSGMTGGAAASVSAGLRRPFDSGQKVSPEKVDTPHVHPATRAPSTMDHLAPAPPRPTARLEAPGRPSVAPRPHDPGESPQRRPHPRGARVADRGHRGGRRPLGGPRVQLRGPVDPVPRRGGPRPSPRGAPRVPRAERAVSGRPGKTSSL